MTKVLVTGFNPFNHEKINPAIEAVKLLPDEIAGCEIVKLQLPTSYLESEKKLKTAVEKEDPDFLLNVGQAGGRACLTPELVAINYDDCPIADNSGDKREGQAIDPEGPAAYFTQLPVKDMVKAIKEAGIPAEVSTTAGCFVCNHVMYYAQSLRKEHPGMQAGFVHIPFLPEQVVKRPNTPSMPLDTAVAGLKAAIRAFLLKAD
ncbi:pyrrolidone-carboxylate peptidase [Lactobacillus nasalidis]|uniref:Pyrrolidone-carboxylate peptidase n=1 Tax=Lactobacillus nasalidis TaxID=2797258 RepID=A0ABQ3WAN9_9LACO|nr:pyroglutamyl-peptidase I [Lactobacillus nasalidis]GHV97591.1 pyrrolidone-carboxylate peptidase [Lactobacillus nasalidis]GHW00075.1 pyrrolidone-carboxylate peptidase [Lactobacillus nasalidis]GHW01937.1 pyrrolidone-carboxylate peptidase [Lactobacillus nasalidis]